MAKHSSTDRVLALGGIYMAVDAVQHIAHQGHTQQPELETLITSLFKIDAEQVADVYQQAKNVVPGLRCLASYKGSTDTYYFEQTKYVMTLLHLERKLARQRKLLQQISEGIRQAEQQAAHFSYTHPNVLANLADLYKQTISTLPPRIMVSGEPLHLENPDNTNKIRALLLAGVRSAVLWRQCGGTQLHILFRSAALRQEAQKLAVELGGTADN